MPFVLKFGFSRQTIAQKQSMGLYLTTRDYLSHKLSYLTGPDEVTGNRVFVHDMFLGYHSVLVVYNGKRQVISKKQLFGYHDETNKDYRFHNDISYQIADTAGFYLYGRESYVHQVKAHTPKTEYYFSKNGSSEILPLTLENIKETLSENGKFRLPV